METWEPRTRLGRMVKEGLITSIDEIFKNNLRIKEPEIIDILLPELYYEIVNVNIVQRQTDAGEKSRFQVLVCIGNKDGYVGVGLGKHAQIRYAIQNAIRDAKLNIIPVLRGCGSWE
ncbi:30S ribosomal protein S5, partial [archaeon]